MFLLLLNCRWCADEAVLTLQLCKANKVHALRSAAQPVGCLAASKGWLTTQILKPSMLAASYSLPAMLSAAPGSPQATLQRGITYLPCVATGRALALRSAGPQHRPAPATERAEAAAAGALPGGGAALLVRCRRSMVQSGGSAQNSLNAGLAARFVSRCTGPSLNTLPASGSFRGSRCQHAHALPEDAPVCARSTRALTSRARS